MAIHERAWSGLNLLIFGNSPTLPARLEESIASVAPAQEMIIDSFENYEQAYDFTKEKKNVAFIFLLENCGPLSPADVFKNLSRAYGLSGVPCFGVLLYEKEKTLNGYRTLRDAPGLLEYLPVESLLSEKACYETLNLLWEQFVEAFETTIIPEALQASLKAVAQKSTGADSLEFVERCNRLLASTLNVSWIELSALNWYPVLSAVMATDPEVLKPHALLKQLVGLAQFKGEEKAVPEIAKSKESLVRRISGVTSVLNNQRREGKLEQALAFLSTLSKPGAPAMIRQVAQKKGEIVNLALSVEQNEALDGTHYGSKTQAGSF